VLRRGRGESAHLLRRAKGLVRSSRA
jgi:hypothetical protein